MNVECLNKEEKSRIAHGATLLGRIRRIIKHFIVHNRIAPNAEQQVQCATLIAPYLLQRGQQRIYLAITGAALVISAALILGLDGYSPSMFGNAPIFTWLLGGLGAYLLIASWPGGRD